MSVSARLGVRLDGFELDVVLEVADGEVVALLGPNGAGKSTVLRCLAGLRPLDTGRIEILDAHGATTVLDDPTLDIFVEPEHRAVGMVFQDYLLFPHLTALENIAFGLRARGMKRVEARRRAVEWLERVGLGAFADRRPSGLSGGQGQRVALARALATEPALLLLDEPLAALDVSTRAEVRRELRRQLSGFGGARVLVTHDPVDAYALADRVVVLDAGRVAQSGSLAEVTRHPRSRYIADLVGLNLLSGVLAGHELRLASGGVVVTAEAAAAGAAFAAIRPSAIALHRAAPEGSARNVWRGTVGDLDEQADRVRVQIVGELPLVAEITPSALHALSLRPGDSVWASVKATEVSVYPA
jgi:molybdate transport system ATP-binding protein